MTVEVRVFGEADRPALRGVFAKAGEGSPSAVLWGHEESEAAIYLDPYIEHEPGSLFLAWRAEEIVGYLTGCLDTAAFPSESSRIDRAIREHRLMTRARPMRFFARAAFDAAVARVRRQQTAGDFGDPRWPAHLHINVVPGARGTGTADLLMEAWTARLVAHDSPGCHLQTLAENTRAVRFFVRHGFRAFGAAPAVAGVRYQGRRVHQQTMVRPEADAPA